MTATTATRTWTLTIEAPCAWLTANIEHHRFKRSKLVRLWREATLVACQQAKLPKGITPVDLAAIVRYTGSRPPVRDRLNLAPTIKAVTDGLTPPRTFTRKSKIYRTVGYGFLPDDSDQHVISTTWELERLTAATGRAGSVGQIELTITNLTEEPR